MKKGFLALALSVVILGALEERASAQAVSRHNPYRALNHTGTNYGAQQWERRQRSSGPSYHSYGTPSSRWSYGSAYRGSVARPMAPNCR